MIPVEHRFLGDPCTAPGRCSVVGVSSGHKPSRNITTYHYHRVTHDALRSSGGGLREKKNNRNPAAEANDQSASHTIPSPTPATWRTSPRVTGGALLAALLSPGLLAGRLARPHRAELLVSRFLRPSWAMLLSQWLSAGLSKAVAIYARSRCYSLSIETQTSRFRNFASTAAFFEFSHEDWWQSSHGSSCWTISELYIFFYHLSLLSAAG